MRADAAVSDVVGTAILLAVTVAAVAAAALTLGDDAPATAGERLHLTARAEPGTGRIHLAHAGGEAQDAGRLAYVATVDDAQVVRGTLGAPGDPFALGDRALLQLPSAGPGSRVHVDVVSADGARVLASVSLTVPAAPQAALAPAGFSMTILPLPAVIKPPVVLTLEVAVVHPEGRKAVSRVVADVSAFHGAGAQTLLDDGLGADRMAGDGVWSGYALALPSETHGRRALSVTATDVHGATLTRTQDVLTQEMMPYYNGSLLRHVGFWVAKYEGGNAGDLATAHFKLKTPAASVSVYGATYQVAGVSLWYLNFLPSHPTYAQAFTQACVATHREDEGDVKVHVFSFENKTLNGWRKDRDALRFYLTVRFDKVSGPNTAPASFDEVVSPDETEFYFLLRREEQSMEVRDRDGWSMAIRDCAVNG